METGRNFVLPRGTLLTCISYKDAIDDASLNIYFTSYAEALISLYRFKNDTNYELQIDQLDLSKNRRHDLYINTFWLTEDIIITPGNRTSLYNLINREIASVEELKERIRFDCNRRQQDYALSLRGHAESNTAADMYFKNHNGYVVPYASTIYQADDTTTDGRITGYVICRDSILIHISSFEINTTKLLEETEDIVQDWYSAGRLQGPGPLKPETRMQVTMYAERKDITLAIIIDQLADRLKRNSTVILTRALTQPLVRGYALNPNEQFEEAFKPTANQYPIIEPVLFRVLPLSPYEPPPGSNFPQNPAIPVPQLSPSGTAIPIGDPFASLPKDIVRYTAMNMSLDSIVAFCATSRTFKDLICDNELFWMEKVRYDFDETIESAKATRAPNMTWKQYYRELKGLVDQKNSLDFATLAPDTVADIRRLAPGRQREVINEIRVGAGFGPVGRGINIRAAQAGIGRGNRGEPQPRGIGIVNRIGGNNIGGIGNLIPRGGFNADFDGDEMDIPIRELGGVAAQLNARLERLQQQRQQPGGADPDIIVVPGRAADEGDMDVNVQNLNNNQIIAIIGRLNEQLDGGVRLRDDYRAGLVRLLRLMNQRGAWQGGEAEQIRDVLRRNNALNAAQPPNPLVANPPLLNPIQPANIDPNIIVFPGDDAGGPDRQLNINNLNNNDVQFILIGLEWVLDQGIPLNPAYAHTLLRLREFMALGNGNAEQMAIANQLADRNRDLLRQQQANLQNPNIQQRNIALGQGVNLNVNAEEEVNANPDIIVVPGRVANENDIRVNIIGLNDDQIMAILGRLDQQLDQGIHLRIPYRAGLRRLLRLVNQRGGGIWRIDEQIRNVIDRDDALIVEDELPVLQDDIEEEVEPEVVPAADGVYDRIIIPGEHIGDPDVPINIIGLRNADVRFILGRITERLDQGLPLNPNYGRTLRRLAANNIAGVDNEVRLLLARYNRLVADEQLVNQQNPNLINPAVFPVVPHQQAAPNNLINPGVFPAVPNADRPVVRRPGAILVPTFGDGPEVQININDLNVFSIRLILDQFEVVFNRPVNRRHPIPIHYMRTFDAITQWMQDNDVAENLVDRMFDIRNRYIREVLGANGPAINIITVPARDQDGGGDLDWNINAVNLEDLAFAANLFAERLNNGGDAPLDILYGTALNRLNDRAVVLGADQALRNILAEMTAANNRRLQIENPNRNPFGEANPRGIENLNNIGNQQPNLFAAQIMRGIGNNQAANQAPNPFIMDRPHQVANQQPNPVMLLPQVIFQRQQEQQLNNGLVPLGGINPGGPNRPPDNQNDFPANVDFNIFNGLMENLHRLRIDFPNIPVAQALRAVIVERGPDYIDGNGIRPNFVPDLERVFEPLILNAAVVGRSPDAELGAYFNTPRYLNWEAENGYNNQDVQNMRDALAWYNINRNPFQLRLADVGRL